MKLIAGRLNSENITRYWSIDEETPVRIGGYAIVENKGDYDLIKIIGFVTTDEKYSKFLTGVNVSKKVIKYIPRNEIRED